MTRQTKEILLVSSVCVFFSSALTQYFLFNLVVIHLSLCILEHVSCAFYTFVLLLTISARVIFETKHCCGIHIPNITDITLCNSWSIASHNDNDSFVLNVISKYFPFYIASICQICAKTIMLLTRVVWFHKKKNFYQWNKILP